ncbi:MAG: pteridine reductase [Chromatiales bacterium]|jgi:pteridine reductase|nr:pteridine reductase [Chromatiales bacterium]MDX9765996.1 pteridine reductase [Ectothiorhodospiraceae bacterium]
MQALTDRSVLITGAARRIGAAIARRLHAQGANLVLHYRSSAADAESLRDELLAQRANSVALVQGDLLKLDDIERIAAEAQSAFGRLDVLVNNASTFYPTPVGGITAEHWDDLMGSNLRAPLFLSQACAPHLAAREGVIVNIVDIHGQRPLKNYPLYCAAKAGLHMLTQALARELGPQVRVNGVAPGAILWPEQAENTAMYEDIIQRTALKREGSPEDVADAVLFLVRDARYVTGQIIPVDGGRLLAH